MEINEEIEYKSLSDQICIGIVSEVFPVGWNNFGPDCQCARLTDGTYVCLDFEDSDCAEEIRTPQAV